MGTVFLNRISGKEVRRLRGTLLPGQYRILADAPCVHNSVAASHGDFVMPDQSDQWSVGDGKGKMRFTGGFLGGMTPLPREQQSFRDLVGRLAKLIETGAPWSEWTTRLPLAPGLAEKTKLKPLEIDLQEYLWHLREVCRNPRTHLKHETERLPVSRARRVPLQAINHLVSHTEDWQHRTLVSVIPHHILATIPEDDLDLYENRVAARLVDHLHRYLRDRREELRAIKGLFDEVRERPDPVNWRRQKRVFALLGKAVAVADKDTVTETREIVDKLYLQVLNLFDSPLYRSIPQHTRVSPVLKATNIFANDPHYRYVSRIWRSWLDYGYKRPSPAREFYREQQVLCKGFDWFCALLVCRALGQLGYETESSLPFTPGGKPLPLSAGPGKCALLDWSECGTLTVQADGTERAVFLPLVSALRGGEDATDVCQALDTVLDQVAERNDQSLAMSLDDFLTKPLQVVLYNGAAATQPGLSKEHALRLDSIGNDLREPSLVGFCPVSTYDIGSVERVARALRWALLGRDILSYPPTVEAPLDQAHEIAKGASWIKSTGGPREYSVCRPPSAAEVHAFGQRLESAKKPTGSAKISKPMVTKLEDFDGKVHQAISRLDGLLNCPVCRNPPTPWQLQRLDCDRLICTCAECDSRWGTYTCGNCGRDFPFLELDSVSKAHLAIKTAWVNDLLGMDVLASPCWRPGHHRYFICPWCGTCRKSENPGEPYCSRCYVTETDQRAGSMGGGQP